MTRNQMDQLLRNEARPLIESFKRRMNDRILADAAKRTVEALMVAHSALSLAAETIADSRLDDEYRSVLNGFFKLYGVNDLRAWSEKIQLWSSEITQTSMLLATVTGTKTEKARRGEHGRKYLPETEAFIELYERIAGRPVPFPKGAHRGQPIQDSTEFIRSCLNQLDDSIGTAQAITCIRNALSHKKAVDQVLTEILAAEVRRQ